MARSYKGYSRRYKKPTATWRKAGRRKLVTRARQRMMRKNVKYRRYYNPFTASSMVATLVYSTNLTLNPTPDSFGAGGSNTWMFSTNGLYDPDITSTGHQPMFFDNYMQLFKRYRVIWSKITATVVSINVNTATVPTGGATVTQPNYAHKLFIIRCRDLNDVPGSANNTIEESGRDVTWRYVAPALTGKLPKLSMKTNVAQFVRKDRKDATLTGFATSNPLDQSYHMVAITSAGADVDPPVITVAIRIQFRVEFTERELFQNQN